MITRFRSTTLDYSSERRLDDLDALGAERLVEGTGELGIPVADDKPDVIEPLPHCQVAGLLSDPGRVGIPGDAGTCTRRDPI